MCCEFGQDFLFRECKRGVSIARLVYCCCVSFALIDHLSVYLDDGVLEGSEELREHYDYPSDA
jgi:hypothetical protein